jgi:hypothetical protein
LDVFGSGVELVAWATFVIQPPPFAAAVTIVNEADAPLARDEAVQRTVLAAAVNEQPGWPS